MTIKRAAWAVGLALLAFGPAVPMMLGFGGVDSNIQALPALMLYTVPLAVIFGIAALLVRHLP